MPRTKTIGIIGLGSIGMRHKENLWKHLGQTEVIGYDPDPAKRIGTGWVIDDLNKMIDMSEVIIIASPTVHHIDHMKMMDGCQYFIEKPLADRLMKGTFTTPTMVGYNLRFHPCVKRAKEWLDDGVIGSPIWANFTLAQRSVKPPYLRDGVVLNWSHEIDLCLYLLGSGSHAASNTRLSNGRDDISDILITHDNGCRSGIHLDYVTEPEVRQTMIVGKTGQIIIDLVSHNAWLRDNDGQIIQHIESEGWDGSYIEEMRAFLDRCDGKETLGCTVEEAWEVLKICLEVRKQAGLL